MTEPPGMRHPSLRVVALAAGCVMVAAPQVAGPVEFGKRSGAGRDD
jgi:hypothetical protein